mmetsp:Transcript_68173/g.190314  ORF Transcript_68173/g.190314 Transcript_68173/m.190314 type:complete len:204 (+) Transcript_68173:1893-2504(+)
MLVAGTGVVRQGSLQQLQRRRGDVHCVADFLRGVQRSVNVCQENRPWLELLQELVERGQQRQETNEFQISRARERGVHERRSGTRHVIQAVDQLAMGTVSVKAREDDGEDEGDHQHEREELHACGCWFLMVGPTSPATYTARTGGPTANKPDADQDEGHDSRPSDRDQPLNREFFLRFGAQLIGAVCRLQNVQDLVFASGTVH